jgi:flagella basal body P-ring formation protein FlgA
LRHPLWVRARIDAPRRQLVAAAPLKAGEAIAPGALRIEVTRGFPLPGNDPPEPATTEGKIPRRAFRAGEIVPAAALISPPEIRRGDRVAVDVASGPAHLRLEAEAQTGGRRGDRIVLVNSQTKKRFPALVTGPGKAEVVAGRLRPGRRS